MQDTRIDSLDLNNSGFTEIVGEGPLPDLLGVADKLGLLRNAQAPLLPSWINKALIHTGGLNKFGGPNFRAVWGQSATTHAWGQQRLKYPAVFIDEQKLLGHDIKNPNGSITFAAGEHFPKNLKPGSIVIPRYVNKKVEVGLPFWIIERWHDVTEYFSPQSYFLSLEEAWEKEMRWEISDEGKKVDNMGTFPSRGVYLQFFTVKTPDLRYREIADDVINIIAMTLRVEQAVASGREYRVVLREEIERQTAKQNEPRKALKEKMQEAFNTNRLLGNPSVTVPVNTKNL